MKHAQKMLLVPEQLLQSIETEHRLTTPPQLTTLTRLDREMKSIMDFSLPEDQKVTLLDQLLQRYQGLSKQMKSESIVKPTVVLPMPTPPAAETTPKKNGTTVDIPGKDYKTTTKKTTCYTGRYNAVKNSHQH